MTGRPQKTWRAGFATDLGHYSVGYGVGRIVSEWLLMSLVNSSRIGLDVCPIAFQVILALLVSDLMYYLLHRLMHQTPWLWQFHMVHHSSVELDWLATVRIHPLEQILIKISQMAPLYLLGFPPAVLAIFMLCSAGMAFWIHANVPWRFPILRWLIVTPEYHHWHHHYQPKEQHKNFAVLFPLWDLLGGTLSLPEGDMPFQYGSDLPVPLGYWQQFIFPFRRIYRMYWTVSPTADKL
ncbi:MAG: sterol desaturase family protein [Oscillatoriales cyanobacterium SM2_2_1]|nr:sterol desaturase family protein [Oscillatoriales cyanobacterium SM2_2_1]